MTEMVATKGKVQLCTNPVAKDAHSYKTDKVVRNSKVYRDDEKTKVDVGDPGSIRENVVPRRRISVPLKRGDLWTGASDSKGTSKVVVRIKGKSTSSGKQDVNVRRKALADISNAQARLSGNVTYDGSKPKISADPCSRTMNISSRKCSLGKLNINERVGDFHATRKGCKDLRTSTDDQKAKSKNSSLVFAVNKKRGARNSLGSVRKSLPALMTANQNNDEDLAQTKRNSELSGKAKLRNNVVQEMSTYKSYPQRSKASVGLTKTLARGQNNVNAHHWSMKSIKTTVKTSISVSNANRTSRINYTSATGKPISIATISSKKNEEHVKSSLLQDILVVARHEATQERPSDSSSELTTKKLDAISLRQSDRRRSYTSSFIARSKWLLEYGQVIQQEKVPCIDDNHNQLEVAEYVDEIYQFYWVSEMQNLSLANNMLIQTEITPQMRGILINWLIEVHFKFDLMQETLYLMVTLLDQYLSLAQIKKNEMQLVGLTTLLLASKYEDFWHPRIKDLLSISAEAYTRDQMLSMEKLILEKLKFRLNTPTPYVFMLRFLKAAQSAMELEHLAFYLIELCLVEHEALKFKPSILCASAIYVARSTLKMAPVWTNLLAKHARYEVSQFRDCAEMILRFHKAARISKLKVTYDKYMRPELSRVAALKPLDKLPQ